MLLQKLKNYLNTLNTPDAIKHYVMDGQPTSMAQMRHIVSEVLEHGPVAYHYSVPEVIRVLERDGRVIKTLI